MIRYHERHVRGALVELCDATTGRVQVAVASSALREVGRSDVLGVVAQAPAFMAQSATARWETITRLAFDTTPQMVDAIPVLVGRERLLTWLWGVQVETPGIARAVAALLVQGPGLLWNGTPAEFSAATGLRGAERWAVLQWLQDHGARCVIDDAAWHIQFAPLARRLVLDDTSLATRLLAEVRAWRVVIAAESTTAPHYPPS